MAMPRYRAAIEEGEVVPGTNWSEAVEIVLSLEESFQPLCKLSHPLRLALPYG